MCKYAKPNMLGVVLALVTLSLPSVIRADLFGRNRTVRGSGHVTSENRELPAFERIELDGSCDLLVTVGKDQKVVVTGDDNILSLIETEVRGKTLRIDHRGSYSTRGRGVRIEISIPHVTSLDVNGSGDVRIEGLKEEALDVEIDGSGDVDLEGAIDHLDIGIRGSGDLSATGLESSDISIRSHGSGDIDLEGKSESLDVMVRGSGDVNARRLETSAASVEVYGSSDVSVRARDSFDGAVYGSGSIDVYGNPEKVNRRVSGSGDINRR